jgi:hypothetical protein
MAPNLRDILYSLVEKLYRRYHAENIGFDKIITSEWMFEKQGGRLWALWDVVNMVMKF